MFVDSHCHLNRLQKETTEETVSTAIEQAKARGVEHFLCVSVDAEEYPQMKRLTQAHPEISLSCGIHPLYLEDKPDFAQVQTYATDPMVVALGETGLDYHYSQETKALQQTYFEAHIQLANQLDKPLIVHTRDAREDTIAFLCQLC